MIKTQCACLSYFVTLSKQWVEEKTKGRVSARSVASVSIEAIRNGGPDAVCQQLCNLPKVRMHGSLLLQV